RVTFGLGSGADVKGFPSRCGVYLHHCSAIELDFLGLDRFEVAARSWDPAKEDALCAKLQLLGARWWPSLEEHSGAEMRKMIPRPEQGARHRGCSAGRGNYGL
ncbi:uncharacterized protein P884DRAFT_321020, partial [Thermothelomyces heterothallicus CBS 202.75]|uniref:uncharacterized protein n=1 Tax=Thermothelomyces heterothallicus CBS 202.75 TaxID=1149848 RepID=UPI0037438619